MDLRKIDDTLSVTPQISIEDVEEAARLGFKTIVANRPDGEEPGQPAMTDIEEAARKNGLDWVYMPVESGNITRCTILWALSSARSQAPARDIIEKALNAGYDIRGLAPRIAQHASSKN